MSEPKFMLPDSLIFLTEEKVSELLTIPTKTLQSMRKSDCNGLAFIHFHGCVRYRLSDVKAFQERWNDPLQCTEPETADILNVALNTLKQWRIAGKAPRHTRAGRNADNIRYHLHDIEAWINEQSRLTIKEGRIR